jgi:hypothetical protein
MTSSLSHHHFPLKRSLFLAVLCILASFGTSANITYAPPPPVNFTQVVQLNNSAQGSMFIGSKRIESLEITQSSMTTNFLLTYFNRSSSNNTNQYLIANEPGTWIYLKGTQETLSCNLIYETTTNTYGLLRFINDQASFSIVGKIPLAALQTHLPPAIASLNYSTLASYFTPGENCQTGMLIDTLYYLQDATDVSIVTLPTNWTVSAYT